MGLNMSPQWKGGTPVRAKAKRTERGAGLTEASLGKTYSLKRVEEAELRSGREHNGSCK